MSVGPEDVGRRVVVRRRLDAGSLTPGSGARYGDLLGELVRWDADEVAVRVRDGHVVRVARAVVVGAKPVPPAPVRRAPRNRRDEDG